MLENDEKNESITIYIKSSASNLPYDEWFDENGNKKDNPWLSKERAINIQKNPKLAGFKTDIEPIVDWPAYPPEPKDLEQFNGRITTENYQQHLKELEEKLYRPYQYVEIGVKYNEKIPEESSWLSFPNLDSKNSSNTIELNAFSIHVPNNLDKDTNGIPLTKELRKDTKQIEKNRNKILKKLG
jgi:hypothetical protein